MRERPTLPASSRGIDSLYKIAPKGQLLPGSLISVASTQ